MTEHGMAAQRRRRSCTTGDWNTVSNQVPVISQYHGRFWLHTAFQSLENHNSIHSSICARKSSNYLLTYLLLANIHAWYD